MSKQKHTSGEWQAYDQGSEYSIFIDEIVPGGKLKARVIAEVFGPNSKADASLFAAAPNLLEALESLLQCGKVDCGDIHYVSPTIVRKAKAAISKAKHL